MPATSAGGRSVTVTLAAKVDGYLAAMAKAQAQTEKLAGSVAKASQSQAWKDVSSDLLKVGAAATAVVGLVGKAAVSWQSDWAGVQKTVDGTNQQMTLLEDTLRGMARTMPATHTEIAAVAEAAGQLGVATDDVAGFSRVMIQLGETTNLTADQAATSIAQFTNIMGTSRQDVDRLGATLVQLGNNGASTEADIMALGHRLAGVGAQMNMSESDVLGFANAMASVGIEAEAGGTAMTLTLKGIDAAVRTGGPQLETYARTAGMTAQQFAQAWGRDAAMATAAFVEGLGQVAGSGGDVNAILDELGINGIRQSDALIRLANATKAAGGQTDLLRDSLEMGAEAWASNSALTAEYEKRAATAAAQIQVAWNNIRDAAISAGESTLPAIAAMTSAVSNVAQAWGSLPPAVHTAGLSFTAISGAGLLAAGGVMKAVTSAVAFRSALADLPQWAQSGVGALGRLGAAAGLAAAGMALISTVGAGVQSSLDKQRLSADQAAVAMERLAAGYQSAALDDSFAEALAGTTQAADDAARGISSTATALKLFTDYSGTGWQAAEDFIMGLAGMKGNVTMVGEELAKVDEVLVGMSTEDAAAAFREIAAAAEESGADINKLAAEGFPAYRASLEATAQSMGIYNLSQQELTDWMSGIEPKAVGVARLMAELGMAHVDAGASAAEQAAALQTLMAIQEEAASAALAASNSNIAYHQALANVHDLVQANIEEFGQLTLAIDENTGTFDLNTASGRQAQSTLDQVAAAALRNRDAMISNGDSIEQVTAYTRTAREQFIAAATQMGLTGAAAEALANRYGLIPNEVVTDVSAPGAVTSKAEAEALYTALMQIPPERRTEVISAFQSGGVDAAYSALNAINGKVATTFIDTVYRTTYQDSSGPYNPYAPGGILRAEGGSVWGPGTSTSDSILAWLSNGEFVIRAAAAEAIGYDRLAHMNATGTLPAFASGGQVSGPPATAWQQPTAGGTSTITYNVAVRVDPKDLQGLASLEEFVRRLPTATRAGRQVHGG